MRATRVLRVALLVVVATTVSLVLGAAASLYILDRRSGTITSSGEERYYLLHVPRNYDRAKPTPLVVSLHAAAMWPAQQMNMSGWNRVADEYGFIVVYPAGAGRRGVPKIWHSRPGPGLMKDVRFISDVLDALQGAYNIDQSRIYVNGFSLGGGMTFALSCALADRFAAVGMVSAAQTLSWSWCADHQAMPMIAFHGTADLVPYEGGQSPDPFNRLVFPPVRTWTANWARRNGCTGAPEEVVAASDVTRREYTNCVDDAGVVLYTIQNGGHAWPGGKALPQWIVGPTTRSIDATRTMWQFFRQHHRANWHEGGRAKEPRPASSPPSSAHAEVATIAVAAGRAGSATKGS